MTEARIEREVIGLLERLIEIPSVTGEEAEIAEFVAAYLRERSYDVQLQPVGEGRYNVFAGLRPSPSVVFCTHLDTVPPHIPFSIDGRRVFGRGACDAKGCMAAMIVAAEQLRAQGIREQGLLFVAGEETDSIGAKRAAEVAPGTAYYILGEPTEGKLASGQKGTLVFRLRAKGIAGHSASADYGLSATHKLIGLLGSWQVADWGADPEMGATSVNIGRIEGGIGANILAPDAAAEGIFRVSGNVEELRSRIEASCRSYGVELEVTSQSEPICLTTVDGFERQFVAFGSDAPYLAPLGQVLMMGPGSIRFAHRQDEQIRIDELVEAVQQYQRLAHVLLEG